MHPIALILAAVATTTQVPRAEAARAAAVLAEARANVSAALAESRTTLAQARVALSRVSAALANTSRSTPPAPWAVQDPGDSLYRAGRAALNANRYQDAARLFMQLQRRFPRSTYTPDSYYWAAFALYRTGELASLRQARRQLAQQAQRHPDAATRRDADVLHQRILGELAGQGDADAAAELTRVAGGVTPVTPPTPPTPVTPTTPPTPPPVAGQRGDEDDDIRLAALNALLQMDADRAVPILRQVLARRDAGSERLRRKAVFLLSQKRTPETEDILLAAARSDPDRDVREQAVFWLSQVGTEKSVVALDSILRQSDDPEIQEKAVFALSQHRSERAAAALRGYAERTDVPLRVREQAIFWLSQHRSAENGEFLRNLYGRLDNEELKEKVIFSVSQMRGEENGRWLVSVARNRAEPIEMRKKALFWAGQNRATTIADLVSLYSQMDDREMREQLIFVYSQRREPAAVDKLLEIARTDPDAELKKKALFWLGQSRDPRVAELLLQIINQPEP